LKKLSKRFEIALIIAVMAVHVYAALSDAKNFPSQWYTRDDAYYYFKVAQNISEGHGSTFDGIDRANGYHPLWMLVCIPIFNLARFDLILPLRILLLVMAMLSAATGVLLYRLISRVLSYPVGMLAAVFWVFSLYVHATVTQFGLETGIAAFSITLLLYMLEQFEEGRRKHPITHTQIASLGAAAVFVLFSRLDMIFLLVMIGLWLVFRSTPIRYFLPLDIIVIVGTALISFVLRTGLPGYYQYSTAALLMIFIALIVSIPIYYFAGLYQRPGALNLSQLTIRVALAVSSASIIIAAMMMVLAAINRFTFPRIALLLQWSLSLALIWTIRLGAKWLKKGKTSEKLGAPLEQLSKNWKGWLSEAMIYYGILGIPLSLYMLWNKWTFGTLMPISGQIKRWWGSLPARVYGGPARTLYAFLGIDHESDFNAWKPASILVRSVSDLIASWLGRFDYDSIYFWVIVTFLAICLAILLSNRKRMVRAFFHLSLPPLLVGLELQILSYNSTGYASVKEWYWVGQILFIILLASLILDILFQPLRKQAAGRRLIWSATALVSITMMAGFSWVVLQRMPYTHEDASQPYMDVLPILEENTEPGAMIGMTGGGNVGYFIHGRTIVNLDGLINSYAYFQAMQEGEAGNYLEQIGLDYVFANPEILAGAPYRGQFTGCSQIITMYGKKALMRFSPPTAP
jgi:hypothetical protein